MSLKESLGILKLEAVHYYVHDIERSRKFYVDKLDFMQIGKSSQQLEKDGLQTSLVFKAGDCVVICSQPIGEGGRAWRYLKKHPAGIGTIVFEVSNAEHTFKLLEKRGGTFIQDIQLAEDDFGTYKFFAITTPFGDTTFRFVERKGFKALFPGMEFCEDINSGKAASNRYGFTGFDHITSNFQTLMPALLWMEHVMGFERYWGIEFHTDDVAGDTSHGSGLKSAVMWDPNSGVKFANNEPLRPHFKDSQINIFHEDHRGDGVQHLALSASDILTCVRDLRANNVEFMPTPSTYYELLPERLKKIGVKEIDEDINVLQELEILVDGDKYHKYMLQIFMKDAASLYKDPSAGPFFYEIIQRKGDLGFGGGNFRALFESIELQHRTEGRL